MKYKKEIEEFISKNFAGYKTNVVADCLESYMISVEGFTCEHGFSIRIALTCGKGIHCDYDEEIALFGYGEEIMFVMNEENVAMIFETALKIKKSGVLFYVVENGKHVQIGGGISDEDITPEYVERFFRKYRLSSGKWALPCTLGCSNFDGSINFSVRVD